MPASRPAIVGHHLIWTLYGHWLANDLRGSGSDGLRDEKFDPLGPVHPGRKPEGEQPSGEELREFYQRVNPLLKHKKFWLDAAKRQAVGVDQPVWASRPYKVFLRTPEEVRIRVAYVERNPVKEGLPPQRYDFVQPYNNWPFHKR